MFAQIKDSRKQKIVRILNHLLYHCCSLFHEIESHLLCLPLVHQYRFVLDHANQLDREPMYRRTHVRGTKRMDRPRGLLRWDVRRARDRLSRRVDEKEGYDLTMAWFSWIYKLKGRDSVLVAVGKAMQRPSRVSTAPTTLFNLVEFE